MAQHYQGATGIVVYTPDFQATPAKGIAALYRFAGATTIQPYIIAVITRNKYT
jgi:hypothetical protein